MMKILVVDGNLRSQEEQAQLTFRQPCLRFVTLSLFGYFGAVVVVGRIVKLIEAESQDGGISCGRHYNPSAKSKRRSCDPITALPAPSAEHLERQARLTHFALAQVIIQNSHKSL
jgi:hypothetical protein